MDQNYIDESIIDTLEKNFMPYAMSVIVSRAIPEIDGFKPAHRKILYTMYKMNLLNGNRTKSANVVGQTMKLNPHGDQAIYATLVRLTKGNEALLLPFIDSKGNFGKVTSRDMKFAAPRYTEVKLASVCSYIFDAIDKNTVDFVENYDGTMKEPTLLPTVFPNILANPNKGIAVGMASNFPSFNLKELCEATIAYLKNPEVDLISIMPAPDFSTGGEIIYNEKDMRKLYETGQGSFKLRGKVHYDKKENMLLITEIPYTTTVEQIIDKIVELIKNGKIKEVNDLRDETDLKGMQIAIDLKRGSDPEKVIAKLFKYTTLEDSFSSNMNLLIEGRPIQLGVKEILFEWIKFRRQCIVRASKFDLDKLRERLHLLNGLKSILLDIDKAIEIIKNTESDKKVERNLAEAFLIDEIQAHYVAELKLRHLNKEFFIKQISEISIIEKEMQRLEILIEKESKQNQTIIAQLTDVIKNYSLERKSSLVRPHEIETVDPEEAIEDYNLKMFLTAHNYLKKVSLVSYRSSGDHKIKEEDEIVQEIDGNNKDEVIFFTNFQNAYKLKLYEISDHKVSSLGVYLPNLIDLEENEEVVYMVITRDFGGYMYFGFENGKAAKVPLVAYQTKTNRKKLKNSYSDESKLVGIFYSADETKILAIREDDKDETRMMVFSTSEIPEKITKNTKGVQVFRMKKNSWLSKFLPLSETEYNLYKGFEVSDVPKSGEKIDGIEKTSLNVGGKRIY